MIELTPENFREKAEEHWIFIKKILTVNNNYFSQDFLELIYLLYIESMIHGYKHGQQDRCSE